MRSLLSVAALSGLFLTAAALPAHAQGWGTIKGQIVWGGGAVPAPMKINLGANQDAATCLKAAKGNLVVEEWVINPKNKGIRWTFVWLAPQPGGAKLPIHPDLAKVPDKPFEIDQPCCRYEPHAFAIRQGQNILAKNSATMAHNVKWVGHPARNPGNNVLIPPGAEFTIKGLVADRLPVKMECNIHPWMNAWVRIFDHPYFAVTDADGNFEIKNAPAGNYRLVIWHEAIGYHGGAAGRNGTPIKIADGKVTEVPPVALKP